MATKKTKRAPSKTAAQTDAYDSALKEFTAASKLLQKGDYSKAKEAYQVIASGNPEEWELVQRAETYMTICDNKLASAPGEPSTADEWYYQGVVNSNSGNHEEAVRCLGNALKQDPTSPKYLFARASAFGMQGNAQLAVADLRQAVLGDPTIRFQAVNDSDFEPIRDDAGFIDLIEPTPAEG